MKANTNTNQIFIQKKIAPVIKKIFLSSPQPTSEIIGVAAREQCESSVFSWAAFYLCPILFQELNNCIYHEVNRRLGPAFYITQKLSAHV